MEKVSGQKRKSRLRGWVFWPPFLVLLMVLILGFVSQDAFEGGQWGKGLDLGNFKWLFQVMDWQRWGYASMPAFLNLEIQ